MIQKDNNPGGSRLAPNMGSPETPRALVHSQIMSTASSSSEMPLYQDSKEDKCPKDINFHFGLELANAGIEDMYQPLQVHQSYESNDPIKGGEQIPAIAAKPGSASHDELTSFQPSEGQNTEYTSEDYISKVWIAAKEAREAAQREQLALAEEKILREEQAERRRQLEITAQREKEAAVVEKYLVSETSLITCSAGFNIQHIIPGFDLCRVAITNLPRNATREEIGDIFIQQGIDSSEFFIFQVKEIGNKQGALVLANAEYGEVIALGLDGIEFRDEVLSFSVCSNASWNALRTAYQDVPFIMVSWRIPSEIIVAKYRTMNEAQKKIRELDKAIWKGRRIDARMESPASIRLSNCPPGSGVDEEFFQFVGSSIVTSLPSSASGDLKESFDIVLEHVSNLRGAQIDTFEVLKRGDQVDGEVRIKVEFEDRNDATQAHDLIHNKRLRNGSPLYQCWLPKHVRYEKRIPRQQYESQKKQWDALGERKGPDDPFVQTRVGDREEMIIEVLGRGWKAAGPLKVHVESMIAGRKLDSIFWHPSFASPESRAFFDRVYAEKQVFVRSDLKTQCLEIYGESNAVEEACQMIIEEVERLGQMETTREIPQECAAFFLREGVGKLADLLGKENVRFHIQSLTWKITIKDNEEANHYLQRLIDQARAAVIVDSVLPGADEDETCPVCYGYVFHPEQLGCGHSYCSGCLKHFLTSAVDHKTFPLVCVGNEATCNVPVAIPFIRRFLPVQTFHSLINAAFAKYLEQHQQELKYCTTPDCKQIYRRRTHKKAVQCPACFSTICPACGDKAHTGISCEEQRILRNPAEQERLTEQLAATKGFKRCPRCGVMIEKIGGCDHMLCRCGDNTAWSQMNVIQTPPGACDYLRAAQGGIYEEAAAAGIVEDAWTPDFLAEQAEELARIQRRRARQDRRRRESCVLM